jgi:hypothetical protein
MIVEQVFNPNIIDGKYTQKKVVKTITTTTYTLIEDDQLVNDLVEFCKGRYCWCCRDVREKDVQGLLGRKRAILNLSKYAEPGGEYIFEMDYPDIYNYRYEGDYCPDAEPTIRRYSFSDVLDEFVELHPDKCRWKETVETKTIEED